VNREPEERATRALGSRWNNLGCRGTKNVVALIRMGTSLLVQPVIWLRADGELGEDAGDRSRLRTFRARCLPLAIVGGRVSASAYAQAALAQW
jgi:hypothetical protein